MILLQPHIQEYLKKNNLLQPIYNAMRSDDYSDVIMVVLNILEKHNLILIAQKIIKSEVRSNQLREKGNEEFKQGNDCKALEFYNTALMYAPQNTKSEILAYSNRSAVYFRNKEYSACIVDIKICFQLSCPVNIIEKLKKRMELAIPFSQCEETVKNMKETCASKFYNFDLNAGVNTQIPVASTDVEVVINNNLKKVIASKDIKVGTQLAVEPSFVSCNSPQYISMACHYCHKLSLNPIPCYGCCFVMFCNETCKELCMKEYHLIECEIMEVVAEICNHPKDVLMVIGAIKFVQMAKSWEEVISTSFCTDRNRIHARSVQEMFDVNNKLSILSYCNDQLFVHGQIFNTSFVCALLLYYLEKVPAFMPVLYNEKILAKEALGRIMVYLRLNVTLTFTRQITSRTKNCTLEYNELHNFGWYPFIGKLKASCMPNVIVSNLNKKAVLIALQPIKKGMELTVSHKGYHLDFENISRLEKNWFSFMYFGKVCKCRICSKDYLNSKCVLTDEQLRLYGKIPIESDGVINIFNLPDYFPKICEILTCLNDVSLSNEYQRVYNKFRRCLLICEEVLTTNRIFDTYCDTVSETHSSN